MIKRRGIIINWSYWLIFLTAFSLPWQTKLIIKEAPINYWEISLFLPMIFLIIFCLFNFKYLLFNFKKKLFLIKLSVIFLIILELLIFISIFYSVDYLLSLYRYFIFLLAIFFLLIISVLSKRKKEIAIFGFLSAIFFQSIIAIFQFIYQKSLACKYIGLTAKEASILGTAVIETSNERWLRAYGALDHPNILGGLTALACLFSVWYLIKEKKQTIEIKIFFWLVYLCSLTALFFSFSRSSILAFFIAKVILLTFVFLKKINIYRTILVLLTSSLLLLPLIFSYQDLIKTRLFAKGRLEEKSLVSRQETSKVIIPSLIKHNIFNGTGFGVSTVWDFKQEKHNNYWLYQPIHNIYLLLWLEISLIGLLAFLFFIFFSVKEIIKKNNQFLIPGLSVISLFLIIGFFDHWLISLPVGLFSLFFFLGVIK